MESQSWLKLKATAVSNSFEPIFAPTEIDLVYSLYLYG
jgi:hypothetical protein